MSNFSGEIPGLNDVRELAKTQLPLRVALVHDWLVGMRGGEKVLQAIASIFPHATIHTLFCDRSRLSHDLKNRKIEAVWSGDVSKAPLRFYRTLLPLYPRLVRSLNTSQYDLVISTSHCVAHGCASPRRGLHLGYVFTPMRYVWDQHHHYLGNNPVKNQVLKFLRPRLQDFDRAAAQHPDHLVADSHHIAGKIERFWERRADVIHPFVDDIFLETDLGQFAEKKAVSPYLVVSALVPYKRIERVIEACARLRFPLTIIGDGPEKPALERLADDLKVSSLIDFRGWISTDELVRVYGNSKALLFPGEEDFGITPLESMACGTPVIGLNRGGVTETVVDGKTGLLFDVDDDESPVDALVKAVSKFESDSFLLLQEAGVGTLRENCRDRARQFSLDGFRTRILNWTVDKWSERCF